MISLRSVESLDLPNSTRSETGRLWDRARTLIQFRRILSLAPRF